MGKLLVLCGLLVACSGRPLEMPCFTAADCPESGCVQNWWIDGGRVAANVCAEACSTDVDCGGATCTRVGDSVTSAREGLTFACR